MKMFFALVLALGTFAAKAEVQYPYEVNSQDADPAVTTLANLSVGPALRRYSVRVRNCANNVTSVMLRVSNAGLQVRGAGLTYADGSADAYSISYTFAAGYDSPWINMDSIKDAGKCVKSFFVDAHSLDPRIKSRVRVFGSGS